VLSAGNFYDFDFVIFLDFYILYFFFILFLIRVGINIHRQKWEGVSIYLDEEQTPYGVHH